MKCYKCEQEFKCGCAGGSMKADEVLKRIKEHGSYPDEKEALQAGIAAIRENEELERQIKEYIKFTFTSSEKIAELQAENSKLKEEVKRHKATIKRGKAMKTINRRGDEPSR